MIPEIAPSSSAASAAPDAVVLDILNAAAQTPSGGNSQPWRFGVRGAEISVWMLPEKDHPILNYRHRGTLLAHGMLLETIAVAARHHGLRARIEPFPQPDQPTLSAVVTLEADNVPPTDADLYSAIWTRCSNRKPYLQNKLPPDMLESLRQVVQEVGEPDIRLAFNTGPEQINRLAQAASTSERVMFDNEALHRLFFEELVWSTQQARQRGSGLQIDTLEMRPAQRLALRLFRFYPLMRRLNRMGLADSIARANAIGYAECAVYAVLGCGTHDIDVLRSGRVLGRLWLKATSLGLSCHLQTGVNFLWQGAIEGRTGVLSIDQATQVDHEYQAIRSVCGLTSKLIPALLRIGHAAAPSARSVKRPPEIRTFASSV